MAIRLREKKTVNLTDYSLPDRELVDSPDRGYRVLVWQPECTCIVLGFSNDPGKSVFLDRVLLDAVPVMKRPSGGEAVLLTKRMLALSLLLPAMNLVSPYPFFKFITGKLIAALERLGVSGLSLRGFSDIALNGRKVFGSSIYQSRGRILFHGILNVAEAPASFSRYLREPQRQPSWRAGRGHGEFITSLAAEGHSLDFENARDFIVQIFKKMKREG